MHYDENEYLHASWMMAAGKRLYVDFFEDHPPHLFQLLGMIRPDAPDLHDVDVREWVHRSRWMAGLCGAVAGIAVMLFAWRATRSPAAAVIAAAVMFAGPQMWSRGLADVRLEPPTLAMFWVGALLIAWSGEVTSRSAIRHGIGLGLVILADAWNAKWPIGSIVIGVAFVIFIVRALRQREHRAAVTATALAIGFALTALLQILAASSFRGYLVFNFRLKSKVYAAFKTFDWMVLHFQSHPFGSTMDAHVRPLFVIAALLIVVLAMAIPKTRARMRHMDLRASILGVALLAAALIEIRFVYPYPLLWAQYLVMAVCGAAVVYAMVPDAIAALAGGDAKYVRPAVAVIALISSAAMLVKLDRAAMASAPRWPNYWARLDHIRSNVRPDETVWISPPRHPVTRFDASYYWYSFREAAPFAMQFAPSPLPPCALAAGKAPSLRFVELSSWINYLDGCACAEALIKQGRVVPSPHFAIFEVPRRNTPPAKIPRWYVESAHVWPALCEWRGFAGTDAEFEFRARRAVK